MKHRHSLLHSFYYAIVGIILCIKEERNIKIHLIITILVALAGIYFGINKIEWLILIQCIGFVLSLEVMNSAIERNVDLVTKEYHPIAKNAKDIAAGAVLIGTVVSVIIGLIIFIPKLL